MIKYNNNNVQKFNHLKYYPKTNIDTKSLSFLNNLNVSEELALDYFTDRFNFFLCLTSTKLNFKILNTKSQSTKILNEFYSFMFSDNNLFNYSKTNQGRYNKIFTSIENNLSIKLSRVCDFDYSTLPTDKLKYFEGWYITEGKKNVFINLISFYDTFGEKLTNEYFSKIKIFVLSKKLKTFRGTLLTNFLNHLADKKSLSFNHDEIISFMKEFFINHQEKNNDINCVKPDWNYFIFLLQCLIPQENYEQYLLIEHSPT